MVLGGAGRGSGLRAAGLRDQPMQSSSEGVHLFAGVVERQGGANRGGDTEAVQNRLGAVMARAYCNAFLVQGRPYGYRVVSFQNK